MILKGQNFRILVHNASSHNYTPVGMATNCTVTLTNNTEDASHKDIVGMAATPVMTSQSWQVQVDSLDVSDVGTMLTAIKNLTPFTLVWDETGTSDNRTAQGAAFSRTGQAYLSDATFQFDDRTNSTKSLQFSGTGPISAWDKTEQSVTPAPAFSFTKGQFVRLFLSSDNTAAPAAVIGAARQLSLHVSVTLENATTKDTEGDWQVMEPTAISYDISTTALVRGNDTITSQVGAKGLADLETIYQNGTPVKWKIANTSGANNRTASSTIVSGSVIIQSLTINAPDRQDATYSANLVGYGLYEVAA
jgi:predicted secreted protein